MGSLLMRHLCPGWTDPRFRPWWQIIAMNRVMRRIIEKGCEERRRKREMVSVHLEAYLDIGE